MYSVIVSIKNREVYEYILLPSLANIKKYLAERKLPDLQIIEVSGNISLSQNYNIGLDLAKYKTKFFIHEDIDLIDDKSIPLFVKIDSLFNLYEDVGLIGVVGTTEISPGFWWTDIDFYKKYGHVLHGRYHQYIQHNIDKKFYEDIKLIDGMFMATNTNIRFSEDIKGFHFYDVDYCHVVRQNNLKIMIIPHMVNHMSYGTDVEKIDASYYNMKWDLK